MPLTVEVEQEEDGRWLAEVPELPGVLIHGQTRQEAIDRMQSCLDEMIVEGIKTTIPFHRVLMRDERFRAGEADGEEPQSHEGYQTHFQRGSKSWAFAPQHQPQAPYYSTNAKLMTFDPEATAMCCLPSKT